MSANTSCVLEFLVVAGVKTYNVVNWSHLKPVTTNLEQAFGGSWPFCDIFLVMSPFCSLR